MEEQLKNGMATAGFVLALITVFFGWIPVLGWIIWLLGLIFSSIGLAKAKKLEGKGKGLAIAGLIISLIGIAVLLLLALGIMGLGAASLL
ncbi:MAG: hypothetical protein JEY96_00235 [Bacteroidales bacterium]|nr:hypothetical protein [Bacteroidales bacterium]